MRYKRPPSFGDFRSSKAGARLQRVQLLGTRYKRAPALGASIWGGITNSAQPSDLQINIIS
jgi:hypothetical protein